MSGPAPCCFRLTACDGPFDMLWIIVDVEKGFAPVFDWQYIAPKHLENHYMVPYKRSWSIVVPHTLQENTDVKAP